MARIVHVCPRYFPAFGGVELFFRKLDEELSRRGHSILVWTTDARTVQGFTSPSEPRFTAGCEQINGVDVQRFPVRYVPAQRYVRTAAHLMPFGTRWKSNTLRCTPWVPALTRAAAKFSGRVDIVHAAGLPYSSLLDASVRLAARAGARLVISPFLHVAPPGPAGIRMRRAYLSALNIRLLSWADRLFVQTDLERRTLADAGLPTARQTVIGLGVDPEDCTGGCRQRFRQAWRISPDAVVVGHLANKSWDKGTVDLLDAAEQLWRKGLAFVLVLAGPEMRSFTRRWTRVRYPQHIVNLGELSDQDRRDFLAAVDVFALPSYVESFGLSPLEAALNGAAVLTYAHGGPSQIFRHEINALVPPVGDIAALARSLEALVTNPSLRSHLAMAARDLAGEYSWTRALEAVLAAYVTLW